MSCRTTRGGAVALRLARHYSALPEKDVQALFHSLKREGADLPPPTDEEIKMWQVRQRALIEHSNLTDRQKEKAEQDVFRSNDETPDGALFHAWSRVELRARQEAAIRSIDTAIDLEPPGSQSEQYTLGEDGRPTHVWYASYGSNMDEQRFLTYIEGGTPKGTTTRHTGSRDQTPPQGDIPIRFPGRMHFAYASGRWDGGGVAFVDSDTAGHALGRAYLITSRQFDDVVSQENGRVPRQDNQLPIGDAIEKGKVRAEGLGLYNTLVHIGDYQGAPVITFTGDFTAQEALREGAALDRDLDGNGLIASNEPAPNYMRMIGSGLKETFDMTEHQQADYLRGAGGAEEWPRRLLLRTLRTPATPPRRQTTRQPTQQPLFTSPTRDRSSQLAAAEEAEARSRQIRGTTGGTKSGNPWVITRPEPTTRKQGSFSIKGNKTCPFCGKPGHGMHDCPLIRQQED